MPDSNVPCPEPIAYSNESYGYADIDFTTAPHPVFDNQAKLVPVDKILASQLGEITKPVQDSNPLPQIVGAPVLPSVGESNAKPLLTSYAGADITLPTTLGGKDINSVSVNDIVTQPNQPAQPAQPAPEPIGIKPVPMAPMTLPTPSKSNEKFSNLDIPYGPEKPSSLAKFIYKNDPVGRIEHFGPAKKEHFGGNKEHFGNVKTMDNIVILAVFIAVGYYVASTYYPDSIKNIDVSKIPIISQLNDPNVTSENKIIIVIAIVLGIVLVSRTLK